MDNENATNYDMTNEIYSSYMTPENYYSIENYSKKRKKTIKKRSFFNFFMIFSSILLSLSLANILCIGLYSSGFSLISNTNQKKSAYYMLQVGNYSNYADAQKLSKEVTEKGGAGYVFFDGGYRVLLSAYNSKNDADSVVKNIVNNYPNVKSFVVEILDAKDAMKTLNRKQQSFFKNVITITNSTIAKLYEQFVSYDKEEDSIEQIKNKIATIKTNFENAVNQYDNSMIGEDPTDFVKFRSELSNIFSYLDNITNSSMMGNEFSSVIKYQHISTIFSLKKAIKYLN